MTEYNKRIVYLSDAQRQELFTNGSITVDGKTITYDPTDIYATPNGPNMSIGTVSTLPAGSSATAAIRGTADSMILDLGIPKGDVPLVETVTGTTPTIIGQPNVRYVCGEVTTIDITPPSAGSIDVIFESGTTPAVLTLPSTALMPEWFDATSLDANTIYEILITDGVYGSVMSWPT